MSQEHMQGSIIDVEKTREYSIKVIGRLGDLGLGNPNGIPSRFAEASDAEIERHVQELAATLTDPTDLRATACIDGRRALRNADGTHPEVRLRRVGGSASNLGIALNSEASIVDTLSPDAELGEQIETVDEQIKDVTGFDRSAHLGGCGGANGEVSDDEAIHANPAILAATKAFMEIPEVKADLGADYDDELGGRVRENAGKTAELLRAGGWDGQTYVDGVVKENPRGVEDLEVDRHDEKFHGHKENMLLIIIGDQTVTADDEFVWNLKASKEVAGALAGQRGHEGYTQALIAEVAKHMAVGDRLPSDKTPVVLLSAA